MAIQTYAPECSVVKVFGSEALNKAADMCLQAYGGYGYTEEYPAEKILRDCRVNRIFEGTNEINRQITIGSIMRAAMKNEIPLLKAVGDLMAELKKGGVPKPEKGPVGTAAVQTELAKELALYSINVAFQKLGEKFMDEQIVAEMLADMVIECYCMDSVCARTIQLIEKKGEKGAEMGVLINGIWCFEAHNRVADLARRLCAALSTETELNSHLENLAKMTGPLAFNFVRAKHQVAELLAAAGEYKI